MSNTKAAQTTNWANRTKTAIVAVPLSSGRRDYGTKYKGVVEEFKPRSYATGSFGIEIKYTVEGYDRPVWEHVVLAKLNNAGQLEATKYGESTLKKRLQAFGLDSAAINAFPIPRTPKDESEAYNFRGIPVNVYLADTEYMGKPKKDVTSVFGHD